MKFINPIYYTEKIRNFIDEITNEYKYTYFYQLSYDQKCQFAALLMEAAGKNYESECITESKSLDQLVHYLKKSLLNEFGSENYNQNLLTQIKSNAVSYHEETMQALFEDLSYVNYVPNNCSEVNYANS